MRHVCDVCNITFLRKGRQIYKHIFCSRKCYSDYLSIFMKGNKNCKDKKLSKEHIEAIIKANLGRKRSEETRRKMSLAQTGNKKWLGKKHSEDTKKKMALRSNGRIMSEATCKKLSESLKGNTWTEERRKAWSERKKGAGNNNWKGGITPKNRLIRTTWQYRLWSIAIRKRDGKCNKCGTDKNLHAHHIERFILNKEKQFDLSNGITLCGKCHYTEHTVRGGNHGR